ncbi:MAG: spore gernimation protein [Coriobacteriaceae bacterium]|nr:spore gernimation protein [Coriobacteriaceae bacterium]
MGPPSRTGDAMRSTIIGPVLVCALTLVACSPAAPPAGPPAETTPAAEATGPAGFPAETGTSTGDFHPKNAPVVVYLVGTDEKLAPARRTVEAPAVAKGAMEALLAGPNAAERAAGLGTLVPAGTRLLGVKVGSDGVAVIDLSEEFDDGGGTLSMTLRAAQLVYTFTQFPNVQGVRFRMEGKPLDVLGGEGIILEGAQTRAMWAESAPAVLIERPAFGDRVSSPLTVTGSANVFEAVFRLEVVGPDGKVLAAKVVQASSGTGTRGTFSATLPFERWGSGTGKLVASFASPKDGTKVIAATVPLTLAE